MIKRLFDILFSATGIVLLSPVFIIISACITLDGRGGVFYIQKRVGRNNKDFKMIKFRTMKTNSEAKGLLTIGTQDKRITRIGLFLRKYKMDELPQLFNILIGDMSFVGPRPEVRKYVNYYIGEQKKILLVRPGLTDYASITYINENEILGNAPDPEKTYINLIMPHKIKLNMKYIQNRGLFTDIKIILKTIQTIGGKKKSQR